MSQPPVYNRQADFTSYQTNNPGQPMSGSDLDNEHNAEKLTLDAILTNMAIIQRDDTALANAVVHPDALNTATLALIAADWTPKGPWVTATDYVPGDVVETSGTSYVAVTAHTAGTFATDYAAGLWVVLGFGKGTIQSNAATFSIVGGTPDVMTAAFTPAIEALADGMELSVRAIGANTVTTPSINIDGLGAKTITRIGNDALVEGDIYGANHELIVRYNLSNDVFELLNPVPVGSALQQITTVAKLKTLSIKAGRTVSTQGFYAAGDGGGAEYHIVAPQAFDGYADHELANGNIAVLQHITAELDVRRCGVKVDGVTDDTVATQAAVDYVELTGAGTVYIPSPGIFLSATITIDSDGVRIKGDGMWNTTITRSGDYGDTFLFTGDDATGTVLLYTGISDLTIKSTGLTTSGAHIHYNGVARHTAENIFMSNGFIGYKCNGLTAAYITNTYMVFTNIYGGSATGRRFSSFGEATGGLYGHPSCGDLFISDFNWRGNVANTVTELAAEITSADGIWFNDGHFNNTTVGHVKFSVDVAGENIDLVFFNNVMFDANEGYGVRFTGNTARGTNIQFTGCHFKGGATGTYGVLSTTAADYYGITFTGCQIIQYSITGVRLQSPNISNVTFAGCEVRGNNKSLVGGVGYRFDDTKNVTISGGSSGGHDVNPAAAGEQLYGISHGGTCVNHVYTGVNLTGNTTAGILGGTGQYTASNCLVDDSTDVASATTTTLPTTGEVFYVTGTTGITNIQLSWSGRRVTLIFVGVLTVNDGVGNLVLAGNFTTKANDSLSLVHDGTNWIETGRSVN